MCHKIVDFYVFSAYNSASRLNQRVLANRYNIKKYAYNT